MNTPYIKTYNSDGTVHHTGNYLNDGTNRSMRRKKRRLGNPVRRQVIEIYDRKMNVVTGKKIIKHYI